MLITWHTNCQRNQSVLNCLIIRSSPICSHFADVQVHNAGAVSERSKSVTGVISFFRPLDNEGIESVMGRMNAEFPWRPAAGGGLVARSTAHAFEPGGAALPSRPTGHCTPPVGGPPPFLPLSLASLMALQAITSEDTPPPSDSW